MTLQTICQQYAAFRKTLGERFKVNGTHLKAFCRAMGPDIDIAHISPEKVNTFLSGEGPLTTSWYVKHNALRGFYRYAISRGFVTTSPLPLTIPKLPPTFKPYIYSPAELRSILDSTGLCRRPRSDLDASVMRVLILLMYGAALRTSEALSLRIKDVDLSGAVLTVRDSKFFKSRLVPIGPKMVRGSCRIHSPPRFKGPGNRMILSLLDKTRTRFQSTCLRGLSRKSECMPVFTAKAAPVASPGFRTYGIPPRFID